ncbi:hypothetical protein SH1V18_46520 [Vallitalea longa]|uniref:Uncharacterized protein n=1 Tax=Vallitalea longa TaxID=2936439 RepID=A0A9W5YES3_9FIRM|nr:hypothetical protein [Vallitalea longa]GKX32172.1 hypothetical protein SH1V18_46520 [Vallitalea longa]
MKRLKCFLICTLTLVIMTYPLTQTYSQASVSDQSNNQIYTYSRQLKKFIPDNEYELNDLSIPNKIPNWRKLTIDDKEYSLKIVSCKKNVAESNNMPYTQMDKVMTIANGQTQSVKNVDGYTTTHMTSNVKKHNDSFSFGVGVAGNKENAFAEKLVQKIGAFNFDLTTEFTNSYKTTDTKRKVEKEVITESTTYSVPNWAKGCNGIDWYTFSKMEVYDMVVELREEFTTDNPIKGYTDLIDTDFYVDYDINPNGRLRCRHCNQIVDVGPGSLVGYHVIFADGRVEHFADSYFKFACMTNGYKPYNSNRSTTISFKYYRPEIKGGPFAWHMDQPNTLDVSHPIELIPKGTEETIVCGDRTYLYRVLESNLQQPYYSNLPGEQTGMVMDGTETTKIVFNENSYKTSFEKVTSQTNKTSWEVKVKLLKWLSLSGGGNHSNETIDTTYDDEERVRQLYEETNFKFPEEYKQEYKCIQVYDTVDVFVFRVKCEVIPYMTNGELDFSNKDIITLDIEKEFPKRYSKPSKL